MKRITKDARHVQFVNLSVEKGSKANINSKEIKHSGMSDVIWETKWYLYAIIKLILFGDLLLVYKVLFRQFQTNNSLCLIVFTNI